MVEIEIDSIWYDIEGIGLSYDNQIISGFVEKKFVPYFMSSITDNKNTEINVRMEGSRLHRVFTKKVNNYNYVEIVVNSPK